MSDLTEEQAIAAAGWVLMWMREGREAFQTGNMKPIGQSAKDLARQTGWNQEKVMHDSMVNIFVVKEAMANIQQNRSLWRKICDTGNTVRYRAYALWYWLRNAGHLDETGE